MAEEVERKFLIKGNYKSNVFKEIHIIQAYLSTHPERTVRVRIKGDKGYITIKGKSNESGVSRYEWEKEIPISEAYELIKLGEPGIIDKTRSLIKTGKHIFEVDEFFGDNKGLRLAEIELSHEDETFHKPKWLGEEVTGDLRYYNSSLLKNPFKNWRNS